MRWRKEHDSLASLAAMATLAVVAVAVKVMIKKYHGSPAKFY